MGGARPSGAQAAAGHRAVRRVGSGGRRDRGAHHRRRHVRRVAARRRRPARDARRPRARCRCRHTSTRRSTIRSATRRSSPTSRRQRPRRPPDCTSPTTVFAGLAAAEIRWSTVELVVGLDTFAPITEVDPLTHRMHSERYRVPEETWAAVAEARRVVAVGTTSVRALESAAASGQLAGRTELFLHPGREFAVVDLLMTNFHLPRTTLLLMIEAFVGPPMAPALRRGGGIRLPLPVLRRRHAPRPPRPLIRVFGAPRVAAAWHSDGAKHSDEVRGRRRGRVGRAGIRTADIRRGCRCRSASRARCAMGARRRERSSPSHRR